MSISPERKLREAVSSLLATHRFFGVLALRMPMISDPGGTKTIAGDGVTFTYNPEWVSSVGHDELKGCVAHIVFACALKHHTRRGKRDYKRWQNASREATAELMRQEGLWIPAMTGGSKLNDLPVELVYDRLRGDDQSQQQPGSGQQDSMPQGAPASGGGDSGSGQPQQQQSPQGGDSSGSRDPGNVPGEVRDAPQGQDEEQNRQWDKAGKQAAQITKAAGHDPGNLEKEFKGQHEHRHDWPELLREYMKSAAPTDYTWSRPNRRFIASGLYLPALHGQGMGPIVVAVDTSGSVDDAYINQVCAEIFAITKDVNPERVHVIQCDSRIQDTMEFDAMDAPDEIMIRGRGGTRLQPVFDHVAKEGIEPDVMIYMTDLMSSDTPIEPDYPVIWGVENDYQEGLVPFGTGLVIPK